MIKMKLIISFFLHKVNNNVRFLHENQFLETVKVFDAHFLKDRGVKDFSSL